MAPVEADVFNSNREPLFRITSAAVLVDLCLVAVLRYIGQAARTLPPAQKTRARDEQRKKNVTTFASLAITSLLVILYHWAYALLTSYTAWADDQGEATPGALWDGWYAGTEDLDWQLGRWWQDVDPPHEFKRVALGTSKALWWTQQLLIARLAFSTFIEIEGRRRDVPSWAIAALWGLAELASLSLAQSLFFVILTLAPVPATRTQHGSRWTPNPLLLLLPVALASISIGFLPGLASNDAGWIGETGARLCSLFLAAGVRFLPRSFGKQHKDVHAAHHAEANVYRVLAIVSITFFLRSTFWGVLLNSGATYHRRYNHVWSTHPSYERSLWSKLASASGKILGAISDDPIISIIGWDVLLSGFSLCIWAAARGLDVTDMLSSIVPQLGKESPEKHVAFSPEADSNKEEAPASPTESQGSPRGKRRGRPKKDSKSSSPRTRRSLRRRTPAQESDADDASYSPPATTAAEISELEHEEEHDDTIAEDAEASALAWGLSLVGGLGLTSAAVMGAEIRGR